MRVTRSIPTLRPAARNPEQVGRRLDGGQRLRQVRSCIRGAFRRFFVFTFALVAPLQAAAPFEAADREVERLLKSGGVPGAALIIVKDGAVVHARAFGVSSVETGAPVTTRTLFRLGSTTKLLVALAALRLVDDGKLRLNQPAGDLLPELDPALRRVTLEQLLTHTAGLADDVPTHGSADETALLARVSAWKHDALFAEPGKVFSYSNPGYVLIGALIARATGQPFSAAMKTLVLDRMGMADSTFRPLEAFTRPVALGHDKGGVIRPIAEHAGNYPPGSLFTHVEDLGRFFQALSPERLDRLGRPRAAIPAQGRSYGYGLLVDEGREALLHTGARSGYGSTFLFLPRQRVAIAVLANRTSATLSSAAWAAAREAGWAKEPAVEAPPAPVPLTAERLAGLSGTYANGTFLPPVALAVEGDRLVVRVGGKSFPATCVGEDRFRAAGAGQLERFVILRDAAGSAQFLCAETWALQRRR